MTISNENRAVIEALAKKEIEFQVSQFDMMNAMEALEDAPELPGLDVEEAAQALYLAVRTATVEVSWDD